MILYNFAELAAGPIDTGNQKMEATKAVWARAKCKWALYVKSEPLSYLKTISYVMVFLFRCAILSRIKKFRAFYVIVKC